MRTLNPGLSAKIGILIAVEIMLITGSFGYLASFESNNSLIGNSINIAGKNRFLTANVLAESEYYRSGYVQEDAVELSLKDLESNILVLRDGGKAGEIELAPLPSEFLQDWQIVYENWLIFRDEVELLVSNESPNAAPPTSIELRAFGNRLIASSDLFVTKLGEYSKDNSLQLMTLQIGLGVLNIVVHLVMLYLILRILKPIKLIAKATMMIRGGNLDASVATHSGTDELRELAESFNSMVSSVKESSRILAAEKNKYQNLYDGAPDLYRSINLDGMVMNCNRAYVESLGYESKDDILGHSIFEHTAEQSVADMNKSFEEWKHTGEVKEKEIWMKRKDGSIFPAALSATTLYDDKGIPIGSNTVIIDETERYKTRKALEESNAELKRIDVMKSDFLNLAAHELRTPVTPILLGARLLSKSLPDDPRVAAILSGARKLNKFIGNLLDQTRLESGTFNLLKERTNIIELAKITIHDVLQTVSIDKKNVEIVLENKIRDGDPDDWNLLADSSRITEVLTNLLDNSIKFTTEGKIRVIVEKINDKKTLAITVSDTGSGIDESVKDKLFQKFSTKSNKVSGTGLGLYLCRAIVEAHGGKIWCANNSDGKGAAFTFTIPIAEEKSMSMPRM